MKDIHLIFITRQFPFLWAIKQERPSAKNQSASEPELGALVQRSFHQLRIQTMSSSKSHRQETQTEMPCCVAHPHAPRHIPASHNLLEQHQDVKWPTPRLLRAGLLPEVEQQGDACTPLLIWAPRRRTHVFLKLPQVCMVVETGQTSPFCATRAPLPSCNGMQPTGLGGKPESLAPSGVAGTDTPLRRLQACQMTMMVTNRVILIADQTTHCPSRYLRYLCTSQGVTGSACWFCVKLFFNRLTVLGPGNQWV